MTHYEELEVRENASIEVIRMAYKALALKYHPDKTYINDTKGIEKMQKINEAYEILSNTEKRRHYDEQLKAFQYQNYTFQKERTEHQKEEARRKDYERQKEDDTKVREAKFKKEQEANAAYERRKVIENAERGSKLVENSLIAMVGAFILMVFILMGLN